MPPQHDAPQQRKRTRILNACERCKAKKIRCSGFCPCQACSESKRQCIFPRAEKKVMVSEKYLQDLIASNESCGQPSPASAVSRTQPLDSDFSSSLQSSAPISDSPIEETIPAVRNPLTSSDAFFYIDSSLKQRYLGSSSSLSFSWQVRSYLKDFVGSQVSMNLVPASEEETYSMASSSARSAMPLFDPASDLPTYQYAKYLVETTFFHLGDIFHIGDRPAVDQELAAVYSHGYERRPLSTLAHAHCLLIIAFGKLFLRRGASSFGPPGSREFVWALRLLWDPLHVWNDSLGYLEALCLAALYLNTSDMRASAYSMVGHAMRIALTLGMNREAPSDLLGLPEYRRRRRIWWTVYIIDRKLTVIMGAPLGILDEDIDATLPDENEPGACLQALRMHIRLAQLDGQVMTSAYKIRATIDKTFVESLQGIFTQLELLRQMFTGDLSLTLNHPRVLSRTAATLHILYHQCMIIATRPLLFALVKQRLSAGQMEQRPISTAVSALAQTCVGSATQIIYILYALHEQDLVEAFLPMDLQAAFSAPFILLVTAIACPSISIDTKLIDNADSVLSWMSDQGNAPARSRRQDLSELRAAVQVINVERNQLGSLPNLPPQGEKPLNLIDPAALADFSTSMSQVWDLTSDAVLWNQLLEELTQP